MISRILQGLWITFVFAATGVAIRQGLFTVTYAVDNIGISWIIMLLFALSMLAALAAYAGYGPALAHVRHLANDQVYLGVFGTFVGVFLAMYDIHAQEQVMAAVPKMLIALWTSIVGMGGAWLSMKTYQFLGGKDSE